MRRPAASLITVTCLIAASTCSPLPAEDGTPDYDPAWQHAQVTDGANSAAGAPLADPYQRAANAGHVPQVANNVGPQVANNAGHAIGNAPQNGQAPQGAPFHLTPVEQQFVDQILQMWEQASSKIKTFDCTFERLEYDPVFGPGNDIPMIKSQGRLTYSKPDKGSFKIDAIERYVQKEESQPGKYVLQEHEVGEHWVCDGKAVYEYKHDKKQLVVQPLPQEMRGNAIVDGPLPFLFGAEAAKLKSRYWIREKSSDPATIHLEAYPRRQEDAANYHHVEVILERKTMRPSAIQVHMPNGSSRSVYVFREPTVNGTLNQLISALFAQPRTPLGWTRVVEELPQNPHAAQPKDTQQR